MNTILAIVIAALALFIVCIIWYEKGKQEGYANGVRDTEEEMQQYLSSIYKSHDDWK